MTKNGRLSPVDERLFLQSVARALDVLEAYAQSPKPKSLGEIAASAGVNKSAAQRIGQTLLSRGYLERADDGGLTLGRLFLDRSFDYLRSNPLIERATPVLMDLRKLAGERVDLSLFDSKFDDLSVVYAIRLQSKRETFYATLAGRRIPTFTSSGGRACLALLPDDQVQDILDRSERRPMTQKTITDIDKVWDKIREIRLEGYSYAVEEALIGEIVLAAAIRDNGGRPVGAVHIAGSLSEWSVEDFRKRFAPLAIEAARALST
ncbi:IclR family transcriptional regulator [Phreatobacter stygius]|uniref:IclR family transcriptional regulator n=1 Tax=Phreatobacter stygius TaxID=1940610 RepID=A0A4D7B272_9HYPH|nr:IclR family transcriptional regulator [Phreatobacter stygius]QCI67829.1 IclR family transcriptional regulator [Phreatobacter stygius]